MRSRARTRHRRPAWRLHSIRMDVSDETMRLALRAAVGGWESAGRALRHLFGAFAATTAVFAAAFLVFGADASTWWKGGIGAAVAAVVVAAAVGMSLPAEPEEDGVDSTVAGAEAGGSA